MKLVRCTLPANCCQGAIDGLERVAAGMTMWDAWDVSPSSMRTVCYRGHQYAVHTPGVLVEILTDESWLDDVLRQVGSANATQVQILHVEESHRIRDGFMDPL